MSPAPVSAAVAGVETSGTDADRAARASAWRIDAARRLAVMGAHAGTAEGVRRLVAAGELHPACGATLEAVLR